MAATSDDQLAKALLDMGALTQDQLEEAQQASEEGQINLVQALLRVGYVTAQEIARAAERVPEEGTQPPEADESAEEAAELELAEVKSVVPARPGDGKASLDSYEIDPEALGDVPKTVAEQYLVLPLQISQDRILVAMADAGNVFAMDEIRSRTGRRVEGIEVPEEELREAIDRFYAARARSQVEVKGPATTDLGIQLGTTEFAGDIDQQLMEMLDQAPVVRIVEQIMADAVRMRASDIHIEPRADHVRVRYRVDGQLMTVTQLPSDMHRYVLSRIKIMAGADIAETRFPQDGRFATEVDERPIDLRVSTLPTYWGEKAVLRILDKSKALVSLRQLGMLPEVQEQYERLIHSPQGMLLVTGPTGSGKSTTLYASLHTINDDTINITTVEDPIEYQVGGINQVQVQPRIDVTFATTLPFILRQDPDVILVGIAVKAALTGHLVLSTLHTNDAPSAAMRLVDMGVEPYLIASSIIGIVAQRLVRRICPRCREEVEPSDVELDRLELSPEQAKKIKFHRGRGCAQCRNTGYQGRIGVYELMTLNNELRDAITSKANAADLRRIAMRGSMKTLKYDGLSKVNAGITSAAEVISIMFASENV